MFLEQDSGFGFRVSGFGFQTLPAPRSGFLPPSLLLGIELCHLLEHRLLGGGVRIHPENARMRGRHGVQYEEQGVVCATLTLVVGQ